MRPERVKLCEIRDIFFGPLTHLYAGIDRERQEPNHVMVGYEASWHCHCSNPGLEDTMAEVLRSFDEPIGDDAGQFHARVVGRLATDGMWEGWLEFVPLDARGADALISAVESRQPEHEHLEYWASGLSVVYAEGALQRARRPATARTRVIETSASEAPARSLRPAPPRVVGTEPVLDPFEVGSHSLDILAQELHALGRARLLNLIVAYQMSPREDDLQQLTDAQLISVIVASVKAQLDRPK
jgi:hypothetical protein